MRASFVRGVATGKAIKPGYERHGTSSQGGLKGCHCAGLLACAGFIPGMKEERLLHGVEKRTELSLAQKLEASFVL